MSHRRLAWGLALLLLSNGPAVGRDPAPPAYAQRADVRAFVDEMVEQHGWSRTRIVPHGGHQMSLNMAAGLGLGGNESYPGVFQPFGGFADGIRVEHGKVGLPDIPGIGFEQKNALFDIMRRVSADE